MWNLCFYILYVLLILCVVIAMFVENCDREGFFEGDEWRDEVFLVYKCWRRGIFRFYINFKGGDVVIVFRN